MTTNNFNDVDYERLENEVLDESNFSYLKECIDNPRFSVGFTCDHPDYHGMHFISAIITHMMDSVKDVDKKRELSKLIFKYIERADFDMDEHDNSGTSFYWWITTTSGTQTIYGDIYPISPCNSDMTENSLFLYNLELALLDIKRKNIDKCINKAFNNASNEEMESARNICPSLPRKRKRTNLD